LTWEIYRVSSASNNPPANAPSWPFFPSPVDALRQFLQTGTIHSNYLSASASLSGLALPALTEAQAILAGINGRPVVTVALKVRPDTFTGACVVLDTLAGQPRALLDANGAPFEFLDAFTLPPGTMVTVVGYEDLLSSVCPTVSGLEVISVSIQDLPYYPPVDSDGDLMLDALELALFGDLLQSGFSDLDGDGFSNAQEIFDGTDPADAVSHSTTIANLALPTVQLQMSPGGPVQLLVQWPSAYVDKVQFIVLGAPGLGSSFAHLPASQSIAGSDRVELLLPNPGGTAFFYKVAIGLK
jgi:hypothetical protein